MDSVHCHGSRITVPWQSEKLSVATIESDVSPYWKTWKRLLKWLCDV